ncbi:GntR family transcriptional regulator [Atlantibacter hermannii]|uniref:GntR family transcriptional regulator n=1 Tax=Atlantibacter hermannii TaxID=565 RepID=UPI000EB83431|nr:GntR family transcriptional regulator [Atlantibacter hermannii]HAI50345.1 GntR family transcriptional regulator [Enterobacteriaceae bacterium]
MFESDGLPLYLKIKHVILQRILSCTYTDRLPGELILADEFNVARGTIKQAIDSLVSGGMVYREQGKGTFINRDALLKHYADLPDVLVAFNAPRPVQIEVLSLLPTMADHEVATRMGLEVGSQLMRLERRMQQGDRVVGHTLSWLNGRFYSDLSHIDDESTLYSQLREAFGYSPTQAQERFLPVVSDARLARLLNIEPGQALFRIERVARNPDDVVLEYSVTHVKDAALSLQIAASQNVADAHWNCKILPG